MTHANGSVHLPGSAEILGWCEYNGTSDIMCTTVHPTYQAMSEAWRTEDAFRVCRCGARLEIPVWLWSDYGNEFGWPSVICGTCMAIIGHRSEEDADDAGERLPLGAETKIRAALRAYREPIEIAGAALVLANTADTSPHAPR